MGVFGAQGHKGKSSRLEQPVLYCIAHRPCHHYIYMNCNKLTNKNAQCPQSSEKKYIKMSK